MAVISTVQLYQCPGAGGPRRYHGWVSGIKGGSTPAPEEISPPQSSSPLDPCIEITARTQVPNS